jgi:hypothetical protein
MQASCSGNPANERFSGGAWLRVSCSAFLDFILDHERRKTKRCAAPANPRGIQ